MVDSDLGVWKKVWKSDKGVGICYGVWCGKVAINIKGKIWREIFCESGGSDVPEM